MKTKSPDTKNFTLEIHVRLQSSDYKTKLGLKRAWMIALLVALIRPGIKLLIDH
jgi:hypothetical protein